jgi:hypothetical protein
MPGATDKPEPQNGCSPQCVSPPYLAIAAHNGSSAQETYGGDDAFETAQRVAGGILITRPQDVIELTRSKPKENPS